MLMPNLGRFWMPLVEMCEAFERQACVNGLRRASEIVRDIGVKLRGVFEIAFVFGAPAHLQDLGRRIARAVSHTRSTRDPTWATPTTFDSVTVGSFRSVAD